MAGAGQALSGACKIVRNFNKCRQSPCETDSSDPRSNDLKHGPARDQSSTTSVRWGLLRSRKCSSVVAGQAANRSTFARRECRKDRWHAPDKIDASCMESPSAAAQSHQPGKRLAGWHQAGHMNPA